MKHAPFTCLLAALCSATNSLAHALQAAAGLELIAENMQELECVFDKHLPTSPGVFPPPPHPTSPQVYGVLTLDRHRRRQGAAVVATDATLDPSQYPSVTVQWFESTIAGTTTYVEITYTQTFASVPDQWPTAGAGSIGYGTLTDGGAKKRTAAEPMNTGVAGRIRT